MCSFEANSTLITPPQKHQTPITKHYGISKFQAPTVREPGSGRSPNGHPFMIKLSYAEFCSGIGLWDGD
jgi:hypothetical protein